MTGPTIFTYWEPAGEMSPYLQLCLRTWERHLPGPRIVVLDRERALGMLDDGAFDGETLRSLSPAMQKDVLMVAVLERHGGVFMDVDTLVFRDLAPLLEPLRRSGAVMLGMHMAFLAALPDSRLLAVWRSEVQDRLHRLAVAGTPPDGLPWDHLGNAALRSALDRLAGEVGAAPPITARLLGVAERIAAAAPRSGPGASAMRRLGGAAERRRLQRIVRGPLRDHLTILDARTTGFIAEAAHLRSPRIPARRAYERFWFEDDLPVTAVTALDPVIVGLHNSWTPSTFAALGGDDVLGGTSLLSRTLRHLLAG